TPFLLAAGGLLIAQPASAAICVLTALNAVGALGDPTENFTVMTSESGGGRSAGFTALITLGSSTITVDAPSVTYTGSKPHSGDQPQIKYRAVDTLGFPVSQQDFTNQATSFNINGLLGLVTATVDGKLTNPAGFAE